MLDTKEWLGILAGIISFFAFSSYYVSIIRGKSKPNQATWLILTIVSLLILLSYYAVGAKETLWLPASYTVGQLITFILALKYGHGSWEYFDKICLTLALLSIIVWILSGSAIYVLIINIFVDFLGMLPTIRKTYLSPFSEEGLPWFLTVAACTLNVFAISSWQFDIWVYPMYMLLINGAVLALVYKQKLKSTFSKN